MPKLVWNSIATVVSVLPVTTMLRSPAGITVIVRLLSMSPDVAIMSAVPAETAVTKPVAASTVATAGLLEVQTTVWSVASSGETMALACTVSLTDRRVLSTDTSIAVTGTRTGGTLKSSKTAVTSKFLSNVNATVGLTTSLPSTIHLVSL
ncbi:hypothetical protein Barb6_02547 [Bacteroidales bacterium Barb6]|nr:hypothetical protein Barb6_02547 [Bacteroidales bacterium Barb6]